MELNDLKKTWDKLPTNRELDENQLKTLLGKRSKNLIERVERNIKIGFVFLFALVLILIIDEFFISPALIEKTNQTVPNWLLFLSAFSNTLIFTTFLYFTIKYYRVKRECDLSCNLKDSLKKIIETLKLYQQLFYMALGSLTITMALGFVSGLYQESVMELEIQNAPFSEIQPGSLLLEIVIGLVFLIVAVGGIFIFLRWGFRRLYGNYYHKLKQTLKELN